MKTLIPLMFLILMILGCSGRVKPESTEAKAREIYAAMLDKKNFINHVSYSTSGSEREVLVVSITDTVSPGDADSTVNTLIGLINTRELKSLGFKKVHFNGGRGKMTDKTTINETLDLDTLK